MQLPITGLGTYRLDQTYQIVKKALQLGYRHIDTAELYGNEKEVYQAIIDSQIPRQEIFITTKISKRSITKNQLYQSIQQRLSNLRGRINLLLLHGPYNLPGYSLTETWQIFVQICQKYQYQIDHLGVSNFEIHHLEQLKIQPWANQIEISPFLPRKELVDYCQQHQIKIIAHSSLTKGIQLHHPILKRLGNPAQVLLQWARQKGYYVIPRSSNLQHLVSNLHIKKLDNKKMQILDQLDCHFATHPKLLFHKN